MLLLAVLTLPLDKHALDVGDLCRKMVRGAPGPERSRSPYGPRGGAARRVGRRRGGFPTRRTRPDTREADRSRATAGLNRQKAATQAATLRGNPVEHGNIDAIETGGQARHCAIGLRYHDLRMCDHR